MDRDRFPRDKTCGSGLSPAALHVAEALGIGPELRKRANPVLTVRFVTPSGEVLRVPANSAAVILLRKEFDNLLVERASALGVRFRDGFAGNRGHRGHGRVVGVRGLEGEEIRARWTLFADGATQPLRHGRPGAPAHRHADGLVGGPGLRAGDGWTWCSTASCRPLYGWLFPETATRVNIGICVDALDEYGRKVPRRSPGGVPEAFLDRHFRGPSCGRRVRSAR